MATPSFQPPPTYAEPVLIEDRKDRSAPSKEVQGSEQAQVPRGRFNPIWLKWFVDLGAYISTLGKGGAGISHNDLANVQGGNATERFHLTAAEHTALANISSGTYTPTLTNVANLSASTPRLATYLRVANTVTVAGQVDVDPVVGTAATKLGISLPIASALTTAFQCGGTACSLAIAGQSAGIQADAANDRAEMQWLSGDITNQTMTYQFTYQIL